MPIRVRRFGGVVLALAALACGDDPAAPTPVEVPALQGTYLVTLTRLPTAGNTVTSCRSVTVDLPFRYSGWRWFASGCADTQVKAFGPGGSITELLLYTTDPATYRPIELRHIRGDPARDRIESTWRGLTCRNEIEPSSPYCVLEAGTAVWVRQ